MNLFLLDGSIISATIDVGFLFVGAMALTSLFWYFGWHKKDRDTIDTLKKSLDKVQPQHDVLQNQHEHLKSEHAKVKQGLSDLMENYQLLNTKHEDFIANQSSKKNLYEQVDEERQSLLDSYESLENNFNALDAKYNDAETTLDRLEEEIENIKEEKNELLLDNTHLRKKILKLQNSASVADGTNLADSTDFEEGSTAEDDEIEKLIGAAKGQQFSSSQNIIAFSKEAATESGPTDTALQAELENLKADYHKLQVEHQSLNKQFEALKNTHDELIESNQTLKAEKRNGSSEKVLSQLQDEHSSLQDDFVTLTMELNNKVLPQLRATQSLLNKKEEKYRNLLAKMDAQTAKYQNSSNQLKSFEGVRATSQALYTSNKSLAEKNTDLERKYEKLSGEYAGLHSQFRILRDQFGMVESKLESSENNATNNSELAQLSKEYSSLKIEYLATADQFKVQQERIKELETLVNSINESSSYGIIYLPSNLQVIEGIGPKIEPVLNKAGIQNWSDLAITDVSTLQTIIKEAGKRFDHTDPTSWTEQAQLLATGKWKAFRDLEASLITGKKTKSKTKEFDDLKVIEGIGPKIEVLLNNSKIYTWKKLSKTGIGELKRILKAAGSKYQVHDPSTWPEQAALAATWNWTELEALQEELKGGRAQA